MNKKLIKKLTGTILLIILAIIFTNKTFLQYVSIPRDVVVFQGENVEIEKNSLIVPKETEAIPVASVSSTENNIEITGNDVGEETVTYEFAGVPVKKSNVKVLNELKVIPGGQSIGVQLNTFGVLVVGFHKIKSRDGEISPGDIAGIKAGDVLIEINGKKINGLTDVTMILNQYNEKDGPLNLKIFRDNATIDATLVPVIDKNEQVYKIGIYIRDTAAGIGTLTFYHPNTTKYGALGHVISDADTKTPIIVKDGTIYNSTVTSIERGADGSPGEKLAQFSVDSEKIGTIVSNTPFGIFGKMNKPFISKEFTDGIPIALASEVKKGPAYILTVVNGKEVEKFDIEIVSSTPQKFPVTKGLVVKITDKRLLEKTGGIVQGMSGSPIIQDGKLVGAITHVFVNDPTSGYGVHIEWMLHEAGIDIYGEEKKAS